ncbi:MAG: zinc ribbon domain-containing protein [Lachnospiraceae bacterium]|nr:zinc ribbon domain-containing protein [Lachnospiraceae bacterium]
MFCTNCGNEINEGAAFCKNCGAPISGGINQQPIINVQTITSEPPKKKMNKETKKMVAGISVLVVGILVLVVLVVTIISKKNEGDNDKKDNSGAVMSEENNLPKEGKDLLDAMKGDWEASMTGGFYGSHYYVPHWDLFIDSDFIYVTDGAVFNHNVNDIEYVNENGVGYIVFEDVIWHKETKSSVEIVEGEEIMPIRLSFIEGGEKISFEINPDGSEWKCIAEYRKAGSKEENETTENTTVKDDTYYKDSGVACMDTTVQLVLMQYTSLDEFDEVIKNQYGGDASAALIDLMISLSGSCDAETEAYFKIVGKYYVDAISFYELNGYYEDETMINLGEEVEQ